jgi:hypothetical protein
MSSVNDFRLWKFLTRSNSPVTPTCQTHKVIMNPFTDKYFLSLGLRLIGRHLGVGVRGINHAVRRFIAFYGTRPRIVATLWHEVSVVSAWTRQRSSCKPCHLMWALAFLKSYAGDVALSATFRCSEKTFRKWIWFMLTGISRLKRSTVSLFGLASPMCVCF